jgi:hypothetical protein
MAYGKTHKGKFRPKNPNKYVGNPDNIVFRSGWERQVMKQFDERNDVLQWASEELAVRYFSPVDKKVHRYFPDFIIKARQANGSTKMIMVEVKPYDQTMAPKKGKRKTSRYLNEVKTYAVNEAKWKAAVEYCEDHGWEFVIMHERNTRFI